MQEKIYRIYVLSANDAPNEIRYVGVTVKKVSERFSQHKYCAMHPEKRGLPVHKWMWSKYEKGIDILYKEIDSCSEDKWEELEQFYIKKYNEGGKLMNLDKGGKGIITKEKRSKSSIERSREGHFKPITLFDKDGNLVENCPSCVYVEEKYGIKRTAINNTLNKRSKTSKGFYIFYTSDVENPNFNIHDEIAKKNDNAKSMKQVHQFDLSGNLIETFTHQQEIVRKYGYDKGCIHRAIKNKKIYKNSYWSNEKTINIDEYEKLYKFKYNNKLYKSLAELAKDVNLAACTVSDYWRKRKPLKGYCIFGT